MTVPSFCFEPMSGRQIDQIAMQLVKKYQPEVLTTCTAFNVHRFFDTKLEDLTGITPVYSPELPSEIFGITDSANKQVIIQEELANDDASERFFRSTLAHETGHCIMHVPQLQKKNRPQIFRQTKNDDSIQLYRKDNIPVYRNPEWQAWRFAGALLMPEVPLRRLIREGAGSTELASNFEVNISFLNARLKALKIQN